MEVRPLQGFTYFLSCRLPSRLNSPNLFALIQLFRFLHEYGFSILRLYLFKCQSYCVIFTYHTLFFRFALFKCLLVSSRFVKFCLVVEPNQICPFTFVTAKTFRAYYLRITCTFHY